MADRAGGVMQETIVGGIAMWSRWQPDRGVFFNSYLVRDAVAGSFLVDPLEPLDESVEVQARAANVAAIVITNRDHERAAAALSARLDIPVWATRADAAQLNVPVTRLIDDGEDVFGWRAIVLEGFKTPGEMVLFSKTRRTAISGDAFWGDPAGSLRLMPDAKLMDPLRALLSARRIRALALDHLLVGDGAPVFGNAHAVLGAMLEARAHDAPVRNVNIDALEFRDFAGSPPPFGGTFADIGLLLGGSRLGSAATIVPPGAAFCPYHWHTQEEEIFIVWEGTPTLRTPAETRVLRRGDCVLFPAGPGGAHRLSNESKAPCTIIMIANTDRGDVCYYPDSDKLVVEATDTFVRASPQLDYFDRE